MKVLQALVSSDRVKFLRTCIVMIACMMMVSGTAMCPTGHRQCDMPDMAMDSAASEMCLLACGIPLPNEMAVSPTFIGSVASVDPPSNSTGIGLMPEPIDRPPRNLG